MGHDPKIIVALDGTDVSRALALAEKLSPTQCRLKIGKALFVAQGPSLVRTLRQRGFQIFLDLKFHDIPNTVAQACHMAASLDIWMLTVHASGGRRMLEAARAAFATLKSRPLLIAVTILTSLNDAQLGELGFPAVSVCVERLARLAKDCGLDGVICSAHEASCLRTAHGPDFKLVTPGIRLLPGADDDQVRVMTPQKALALGSDYLVIGRPITQSADPEQTLSHVNQWCHPP